MTKADNNTSTSTKVAKGMSTQTSITIMLGVLEIISFSIMSRLLTDKDFGYYAAILAVVTVFQSFAETGIGSAIIQRKEFDRYYVNNSFSMSLIIGVVVTLALFLSANFVARIVADESMTIPLRIISVTLLFNCLSSINISILQRNLHFLKIGIINVISFVVTTIIAIVLAANGYGYYAIITKGVLASILILILSQIIVGIKYKFVFDIIVYKQIFGFGGWLMAAAIFRNIAAQVDRLLMTSLFSVQILGLYTRPKEFISTIAGRFNTIFDTVLFPILSSLQDDKEKLQNSFISGCYLLNLFAMVLSLLFYCNSELLIRIFFGEKWLHIDILFKVLSFYPVLLVNGRIGDIFLRSIALTKQQFCFRVGQLAFAFIFILSCYKAGIVAVAISVMASYASITTIKVLYITRKMGLSNHLMFRSMIQSYRFTLYIIPLYIVCHVLLPNTWEGNIIQSLAVTISFLVLFVFFPNVVGKKYKEAGYSLVAKFVKSKIFKK